MLKTIEASEAEKNIKNLLEEVSRGSNQYILKQDNQSLAVLLSIEDYNLFKQLVQKKSNDKKKFFKIVNQIRLRNRKIPFEEIEEDVAQAVNEVRENASESEK